MFYIRIDGNLVVGKASGVSVDEMIRVSEEIYNMIETLPANVKFDSDGEIISITSHVSREEFELLDNLKPAEEKLLDAEWELKTIELLLDLEVI